MKFEDYWKHLLENNPLLVKCTRITISVDEFKRALKRSYKKGKDYLKEKSPKSPTGPYKNNN